MSTPFKSVLEDIEWLRDEWWLGQPDTLSEGHLRRGSAALHVLLIEGLLGSAWRHYGNRREPKLIAPDLVALVREHTPKLQVKHAVNCVAGGGHQNGLVFAMLGGFKVDNPETGVSVDADSGWAFCLTNVSKQANNTPAVGPLTPLVERSWYLSEYLDSPGGIRKGEIIKRREIIEYFRNYVGGAHHDLLKGAKHAQRARYELIAELSHVIADIRDGLHFELLSMGQSVARSPDVILLADKIRQDS